MNSKTCKICRQDKPLSEYRRESKQKRDGRKAICKVCSRTYKYNSAQTIPNSSITTKHWLIKTANDSASHNKCKAKIEGYLPDNYNHANVLYMYELRTVLSYIYGIELHVDHIIPRSRGGLHNYDNLQILLAKDNIAKSTSVTDYPSINWNNIHRNKDTYDSLIQYVVNNT